MKNIPVRDPLWKHIYIPEALFEGMNTKAFVRLTRIRQLGPTELLYPGAVHTRAGHSIGVYAIAKRLLDVLSRKGADSWLTKTGEISWYAAALFHDIGHFPYTHSLKELPLEDHEVLSARVVETGEIAECIKKAGGEPEQVAAIIDKERPCSDPETLFYRKLLSGVLDPDKLDYLNRDAYYCGVPYGVQDTDFVLDRLIPHKEKGIILNSDGILSVENLLFSKYMMYRSVYWHKQVRIATAMMKKTLYAALEKNLIQADQLYQLDDQSVFRLIESIDEKNIFPEKKCATDVMNRNLFVVIWERLFVQNNPNHLILEDLKKRTEVESKIASALGINPAEIIIDVPEPISFESDLWIQDENLPFTQSSTVFSATTVQSFTNSLRKIRVAIPKHYCVRNPVEFQKKIASFFDLGYN